MSTTAQEKLPYTIARCHRNLHAYWQCLTETTLSDENFVFNPTQINIGLFNPVHVFPSDPDAIKQIYQTILTKMGYKIPIAWWLKTSIHGDRLTQFFKEPEFKCYGPIPIMLFDLAREIPNDDLYQITEWENNADLREWIDVCAQCFGLNEAQDVLRYQQALEKNADKLRHFYLKIDGKIVCIGSLFLGDDTAGCYNLAVLPEYRNRGIASAMHHHRLRVAKALHYDAVTLQATPMAAHLDASIGYEMVDSSYIYSPS